MEENFDKIFDSLLPVYTTSQNDLISEFYVPVLQRSVKYDRVTGFFSSSSLSVAARGLSRFLLNPKSKMRMIVSIKGFETDDKIEEIYNVEDQIVSEFNRVLESDIALLEDMIIKRRIEALAWLLKQDRLEIKVAVMSPLQFIQGMLHSKFGILTDPNGNKICFSGSINESQNGWKVNGEVISVYSSKIEGQVPYIEKYITEFEAYWNNNINGTIVVELPTAIKNKLLRYSVKTIEEIAEDIDPEAKHQSSFRKLRYYQEDAILKWLKNNKIGYFEMATGTGKTLIAINAIKNLITENHSLGVIIAVPTNPLVAQWKKELEKEGIDPPLLICCSSDYPSWETTFSRYSLLDTDQNRIFIFTYQSLCDENTQSFLSSTKRDFVIVCDEMHHAGAPKFSNCLNKKVKYRLGLSATPIRAKDIEGTKILQNYFGEKPLLVFDISRALKEIDPITGKTYLCPYDYYFEETELSPREHTEFKRLSRLIAIQKGKSEGEEEYQADKVRALLISCAAGKIGILDDLIKKIKVDGKHKKMLVYCQSFRSKDLGEKQIDSVRKILSENTLNTLDFTSKFEDPEVRKEILNALRTDAIDAVIAIKCLDEGIDMPDVRTAIILSSSSNSAEFIQRRGRILRNSMGKEYANIYDFLVGPPKGIKLSDSDITLIKREYNRAIEYSKYARNSNDMLDKVHKWINNYGLSGSDMND